MLFLYWPKLLMAGNIFWQAQANAHRMHVEKISAVFFWIYLKNIAWQWHANFLQSFNPEKHQIAMCCTTYQVLQLKTLEAQKEAILQRYICIKNFPYLENGPWSITNTRAGPEFIHFFQSTKEKRPARQFLPFLKYLPKSLKDV